MSGIFDDDTVLEPANGIPLYLQLQEIIRRKIESGVLPSNSAAPTENELIRQFKVGRYTVRQAYQALVNEGLLVRMRGKGTFVVPQDKRRMRGASETLTSIILLTPRIYDDGGHSVSVHNLISAVVKRGYIAMVCLVDKSLKLTLQSMDRLLRQQVSGVVFLPMWGEAGIIKNNYKICDYLKNKGIPFVTLNLPLVDADVPSVCSDNLEGGRIVGEYLRNMGHRRVLAVDDSWNAASNARVQGLADGLGETPGIIHCYRDVEGDFERKLTAALQGPEKPTAIFGMHDVLARRIMTFLLRRGIRIPDDISLVGYDNLEFCQHLKVPLSTVHQPFDLVSSEAVDLLTDLIQNSHQEKQSIRVPVRLIERESVKNLAGVV